MPSSAARLRRQAAKAAARLHVERGFYRRAVLELQRASAALLWAEADFARRDEAWRAAGGRPNR